MTCIHTYIFYTHKTTTTNTQNKTGCFSKRSRFYSHPHDDSLPPGTPNLRVRSPFRHLWDLCCSVLFCFFLIKSQEKCFWECGRPLWTYKASSGSVAPSPPSLPVSYSTSQISDSLIFGDIVVNHGDTYLTVTRHTPAILGQPPMYLSNDAPPIVPLGSHFTG